MALTIDYDDFIAESLATYYPDFSEEGCSMWHRFGIEIELRTKFIYNFTGKYFREWLLQQTQDVEIKRKLDLNQTDLYITFNYTDLLEDIYKIPRDNILHIHGSLKQHLQEEQKLLDLKDSVAKTRFIQPNLTSGHIQFGSIHNNPSRIEDELLKEHKNDELHGPTILDGINNLVRYCEAASKDLAANYGVLKQFIDGRKITKVVVMGHSIMGVDKAYYQDIIVPLLKDCFWTFHYYSEKDKKNAMEFAQAFSIINYEIIPWP